MSTKRRGAALLAGLLLIAACQQAANIPNVVCAGEATTYVDWIEGDLAIAEPDAIPEATAGDADDLLAIVQERGELVVSTDPNYAPQSFLNPDGTYEGFDIDVANEIGERLGVDVRFETPEWDAITAGSWSDRWDISVGSMTVTEDRKEVLSFTQPYYYTPAQMAVATSANIDSLDQLPETLEVTTLPTDAECAQAIQAGRTDFVLWLSSSTTVAGAIAAGAPMEPLGDPVFAEPLSVALDMSGPPHAELLFEIDRILGEMHEDGTLTALSEQWF
ncbi:MAG: transporter substrate-binding domain-containing protein, partial [Candidatus Limnocylindria bacterium]